MINIRPDEISNIIRQQIESYDQEVQIDNVGTVLQIGDGIARVYGLEQVMAGELLEFEDKTVGIALNLENDKSKMADIGISKMNSSLCLANDLSLDTIKILLLICLPVNLDKTLNTLLSELKLSNKFAYAFLSSSSFMRFSSAKYS